ncbi:uncharacterized protein B4U80_03521 [Leptotrombidium deliense]|uniref:Reverse transcriptase domain-containing protein n=1 Tax=Leptotrombidium deliense TaxID=299467 RepID=A0A443QQX2_9ACAR|nr:uncharacterized protein B4U80_03521 [Leptotrombidium deliense]
MDSKQFVAVLSLDLRKAFDTVNRQRLMDKLSSLGITENAYQWFSSYLHNRYQFIQINEKSSSHELNNLGVPQGSILGLLLFELYLMNIFELELFGKVYAYADDMYVVVSGKNINTMEQQ